MTEELSALSFEEALARLDELVAKMADEKIGLEKAFELWEEGQALHAQCTNKLEEMTARLEESS